MIVVPIIISTLIVGVAGQGDMKQLGTPWWENTVFTSKLLQRLPSLLV